MKPSTIHPLQHFMKDIQIRQQKLGEQMLIFQTLQQDISELKRKEHHDPLARKRLEHLHLAMQGELASLRFKLSECLNNVQSNFVELESILKNTEGRGGEKQSFPEKKGYSLGRNFI